MIPPPRHTGPLSSTLLLNWALITLLSTLTLTSANPIPEAQPNSHSLEPRTPISAATFSSDWPTNVVMTGGSETYGMWIPQDGQWHDTSQISCLDVPAYNYVNCAGVQVDQIGVATGYGPCTFVGSSGWSGSVSGASGSGFKPIGPPQAILMAWCAADS